MAERSYYPNRSRTSGDEHFLDFQMSFSTDLIATSIFFGETSPPGLRSLWPQIQEGKYYLLEGQLRPVSDDAPPGAIPLAPDSGLLHMAHESQ
jgi:hypothetical protein